ncbi:ABC transporter ATP-binding protein [Embleya sp. NBC_00888]|uniref:ABC transporter ATP-binding protein n=1 Tax=Embleya sp. NBC_00888 TaxID=2975960 RepID=UPI003865109F|nr:ABC transporter ATP-binding protein [Embleya sp. NBC_00888]
MLTIDNVRAGYGRTTVLHGLSLTVADGDMIAVLGRNGAGKSTLLKAVIGTVPLSSGTIKLGDQDLSRKKPHRRARAGIAYVPQGRDIFPRLSVLDNLRVAAYGTRPRDASQLLEQVLMEFPVLNAKRAEPGGGLSGGQQQILALGRALMTDPRVLLLDEPSEGIQPSIVDQIAETVCRINGERGITVVIVEQNLDFAAKIAPHAHLMDKGQIVLRVPTKNLISDRLLQHEFLGV